MTTHLRGNRQHFGVVVVGFGPTGAIAANLLGAHGIKTLVIDQTGGVYDKPRAIAVDHEIMRIFDNLAILPKIAPYIAPFPASDHFGAEGQLLRRIDMVKPPYPLGYTPTMVFSQPQVEAVLRKAAAEKMDVTIRLKTKFIDVEQTPALIKVTTEDESGTRVVVTADYMIACDGASSPVRQVLGIALEDLVFDEPWLVVDVLVNDAGMAKLSPTAANYCDPARPATYIIGPNNHRRWEIMLSPGEDPQHMREPEQVWSLLSRWIEPSDGTLWRAATYRFHALVAERWRFGRVFLAGDAAHQQPPFLGQGMCQGMRDAANLVWRLAGVLQRRAPASLLDSYEEERSEHVRTLTARIKSIGEQVCVRDPDAARLRDAAILAEGAGVPRTITRQEIVPPLTCGLLAPDHSSTRGRLFPQPWIKTGYGQALMDSVCGGGWRLVIDSRTITTLSPEVIRLAAEIEAQVLVLRVNELSQQTSLPHATAFSELEHVLENWFSQNECSAAIVRPDHYVYGTAKSENDLVVLLRGVAPALGDHPQRSFIRTDEVID